MNAILSEDEKAKFCPYVGLKPYSKKERDYFYGRKREQKLVQTNLINRSLTILCGPSGVGKSSLLYAGVAPSLGQMKESCVIAFRDWHSPSFLTDLQTRTSEMLLRLNRHQDELDPNMLWVDLLKKASPKGMPRNFVLLDQFEDYFLYQEEGLGKDSFENQLATLVNDEQINVGVLIQIREDALASFTERFHHRIKDPIQNMVRLHHLKPDDAQLAITGPLEKYNEKIAGEGRPKRKIEARLVDELKKPFRPPEIERTLPVEQRGLVETVLLQLVLRSLWDKEADLFSSGGAKGDRKFIELRYDTFKALGGTEEIIKKHLSDVLSGLNEQQLEDCSRVFRLLVTPIGTKIAYPTEGLIEEAISNRGTNSEEEPHDKIRVQETLNLLHNKRILRRIDQPESFEIFHDVIGPAVRDWRIEYEGKRELRKLRRQQAMICVLALIFFGLLVYVWVLRNHANRNEKLARVNATNYMNSAHVAMIAESNALRSAQEARIATSNALESADSARKLATEKELAKRDAEEQTARATNALVLAESARIIAVAAQAAEKKAKEEALEKAKEAGDAKLKLEVALQKAKENEQAAEVARMAEKRSREDAEQLQSKLFEVSARLEDLVKSYNGALTNISTITKDKKQLESQVEKARRETDEVKREADQISKQLAELRKGAATPENKDIKPENKDIK